MLRGTKQLLPERNRDEGVGNSERIIRKYGFYERIDDDTIANPTLVLPPDFSKKIAMDGITLPSKLKLSLGHGRICQVSLLKFTNKKKVTSYCMYDGWSEMLAEYRILPGYVLFFTYIERDLFDVAWITHEFGFAGYFGGQSFAGLGVGTSGDAGDAGVAGGDAGVVGGDAGVAGGDVGVVGGVGGDVDVAGVDVAGGDQSDSTDYSHEVIFGELSDSTSNGSSDDDFKPPRKAAKGAADGLGTRLQQDKSNMASSSKSKNAASAKPTRVQQDRSKMGRTSKSKGAADAADKGAADAAADKTIFIPVCLAMPAMKNL